MATRLVSAASGNTSTLRINLIDEATGKVWNGTGMVDFDQADQADDYDISVTETGTGSGIYRYTVPPDLPNGRYIEQKRFTDTSDYLPNPKTFRWNGSTAPDTMEVDAPSDPDALTLWTVLRLNGDPIEGQTITYRMTEPPPEDSSGLAYSFATQTSEESDENGLIQIQNVPMASVYQARWGSGPWVTIEISEDAESQYITGLRTAQAP